MHLARRYSLLASPILVAFTAIACGQGSATLSPTGPTASLDGFALSTDASGTYSTVGSNSVTTLNRDNNGKGGGDSEEKQDKEKEDRQVGPPEKGSRGELSGFVTAANGTSLTVRGITVTPAPGAVIRHGNSILLFASITVGNHVQARGTIDGGTLVATEIKVEHTDREGDDGGGEVRGLVSGLSSTTGCPVLTFIVGTTTVTTSAATDFDDVLCSALANGAVVEVEGTRQANGSILATKVELEDDPDDDDDGVKVAGQISGLPGAGSCPALSFTVGTKQVTTSGSTKFEDVTCATLINGMTVEVKGVLQANGSIAATRVELD